jgi:hypothetical protein
MVNAKWYLVCNVLTKLATDLIQIGPIWGATTGMESLSDDDLATFFTFTPHQGTAFYTPERAVEMEIDSDSINHVLEITRPAVLAWLRQLRDPLLAATDAITVPDRWQRLDVVSQKYVTAYRDALRDITLQADPLNVVWPAIPPELDFVRKLDIDHLDHPSESFLDALTQPFPAPSLVQRRDDQWLRTKAERDRRKAGGIKVTVGTTDYWFWTDEPTRTQYSLLDSAMTRAGVADSYVIDNWKTMSGEFVPMTVGLLHQVITAGIANEREIFQTAELHRTEILASDAPETYDYSQGWPLTYQEQATQTPVG